MTWKLKLVPRSVLKGKVGVHFPGTVTGVSPVVVTNGGGNFVIGIDDEALQAQVEPRGAVIAVIQGVGGAIPTGIALDLEVPYDCAVQEVNMYATASSVVGSIVIDVWKSTHANFPPVVGGTITGSAKPTLSGSNKSQDNTLSGWTTALSNGDILRFNVDSNAAGLSKVTLVLEVVKT